MTVPIPPPAPANLTVSEPNANRNFKVSWDAVSWTDASYQLQETHGTRAKVEFLSGTSKTFTRKPPGTYDYRVGTCGPASNCGSYSAAESVTVRPDAPATPTLACDGGSHSLSWPEVLGATGYMVQQREGQGDWDPAYSVQDNSDAPTLTVGTEYGFQVKACADDGNCGKWSAIATATAPDCTKPGVPGGLAITPTGPDSYKVAWNAASGTAHTYQLQERIGAGNWRNAQSGTSRERTFMGKANGTYSYQVRACPQSGECGDHSAPLSVTVPIPPPVPSGLAATAPDSNGDYTVTWNPVTWGGTVTYALEEQPAGGVWTEVHNAAAATFAATGKANGSYAYRVRACAGGACGGWSGPVTVSVTAA
ncbi:MAG: fibronectin type III domain-containing protein [Gammaproteobacteria bacterium]|nr:fibronectin type III domain-containing protein [Gammaproteobacteria bacterium]